MKLLSIWYSRNVRLICLQAVILALVFFIGYQLFKTVQFNLNSRGIVSGFDFFQNTAGFDIYQHLIDYKESDTYARAFFVALFNTLLVAGLGIIFATLLGFVIGIMRLSSHWLMAKLAAVYVETVRNIPLLLQIFFWYFVVLRSAPLPRNAIDLGDIYISRRGIYLPEPLLTSGIWMMFVGALVLLIIAWRVHIHLMQKRLMQGHAPRALSHMKIWLMGGAILIFLLGVNQLEWEVPVFSRLNFRGGWNLMPELIALLLALVIYTAAFIAEIVRSGILAIPKGQSEAALSLGLSTYQKLRLIIIPQAMRVIFPPLTNQYLNITKNSSLAAAIAYPDLVSVLTGPILNQTGQAIEIIALVMAVYLLISLTISFLMIWYEFSTRWGK